MRNLLIVALLVFCEVVVALEEGEQQSSDELLVTDYRGGTLRMGAFAIDDINAQLYFGPTNIPLRGVIDIRRDLGLKESLVAFRSSFVYRFSKHHALSLGYYKLDLDGIVSLGRTIELGGTEFDLGFDVLSSYEEQITKLSYNFIFHDEGRVLLSVTPGLHFSKASMSIQALGTISGIPGGPAVQASVGESITAPLPMLGGRIVYRFSSKWQLIAAADIFFLNRGSQEGQVTDAHVVVEYKTGNGFIFGGGLNRFSLALQLVDNDIIWNWSSVYTGAHLYVGYHF